VSSSYTATVVVLHPSPRARVSWVSRETPIRCWSSIKFVDARSLALAAKRTDDLCSANQALDNQRALLSVVLDKFNKQLQLTTCTLLRETLALIAPAHTHGRSHSVGPGAPRNGRSSRRVWCGLERRRLAAYVVASTTTATTTTSTARAREIHG